MTYLSPQAPHTNDRSTSSHDPLNEWNLRTLLLALKPHRLAVAIGLLVGIAGGLAYGLSQPPQYESTVEVASASSPSGGSRLGSLLGQLGGLAPLAGIEIPGGEEDRTAVVVLRSNAFVRDFLIQQDALDIVHEDSRGIVARILDQQLNEQQIVNRFRTQLMRVEEDRRVGTTKLTIRSHDREAAARWANGMIEQLNASQRQRAIEESTRSISYLDEQIARASSVEVQRALYSVMEGELKAIAIASARKDYTFRVLDPAIPALESEPVAPNVPLLAVFYALAGGAAGLSISIATRLRLRPTSM